jgi:hypothetical protein
MKNYAPFGNKRGFVYTQVARLSATSGKAAHLINNVSMSYNVLMFLVAFLTTFINTLNTCFSVIRTALYATDNTFIARDTVSVEAANTEYLPRLGPVRLARFTHRANNTHDARNIHNKYTKRVSYVK